MTNLSSLEPWLSIATSSTPARNYRHAVITENPANRAGHFKYLKDFVNAAHEDARRHLRLLAGRSLDPLSEDSDPLPGYPGSLHLNTLKGYLGEILSGFYVQHYSVHGRTGWQVPAYLLSFHDIAFDQLWTMRETDMSPKRVPGQPGDDCLAFLLDETGAISCCLVCEAKCSAGHSTDLITAAHENISRLELRPVSLRKLIEILRERDDEESAKWIEEIRKLMWSDLPEGYERYDLVLYICGQHPVRGDTWLRTDAPHAAYSGRRQLEAVEVHLNGVDNLIRDLYAT